MPVCIEHLALWTADVDRLAAFCESCLGARAGPRYRNAEKGFESRFVAFAGGARLELMRTTRLGPVGAARGAHLELH
jgi:lactoylglutathione lyase